MIEDTFKNIEEAYRIIGRLNYSTLNILPKSVVKQWFLSVQDWAMFIANECGKELDEFEKEEESKNGI